MNGAWEEALLASIARVATLLAAVLLWTVPAHAAPGAWILDRATPSAFALASPDGVADLVLARDDAPVVGLAAQGLADDLTAVTGQTPALRQDGAPTGRPQVWIGTLGHHPRHRPPGRQPPPRREGPQGRLGKLRDRRGRQARAWRAARLGDRRQRPAATYSWSRCAGTTSAHQRQGETPMAWDSS